MRHYTRALAELAKTLGIGVFGACLLAIAVSQGAAPSRALAQAAPFTTYDIYDVNQRLVGSISPSPTASNYPAIRHTYDALGRETLTEHGYLSAWPGQAVAPGSWLGFTVLSSEAITYDGYNRKIQSTLTASGVVIGVSQMSYDVMGRVTCTSVRMNLSAPPAAGTNACTLGPQGTTGPDRITEFVYDQFGHVLQELHGVGTPLQQTYLTNHYGADAELLSTVDANSNLTAYSYDGFDRLVQTNYPAMTLGAAASDPTDFEAYTYDADDNRLTDRRRDGVTLSYAYDALKRVLSKTVPTASGGGVVTNTTYDLQSHPLAVTYASTGTGVVYTYDGAGRTLSESTYGRTLVYGYDADSNLSTLAWPDGQVQAFSYDAADHATWMGSASQSTTVGETFSYDAAGRLTGIARPNGFATAMTLDGASRLTGLGHTFSNTAYNVAYGLSYTPAGQVQSRSLTNAAYQWPSALLQNQTKAADGLNRDAAISAVGPGVTSTNGSNCAAGGAGYDCRGNLTFDGTRTFTYDEENRLLTEAGPVTAVLSYDPLGRLNQSQINGTTTNFLYSGSKLVAEYVGAGNVLRRYFHGEGVDSPDIWVEGAAVSPAAANFLVKDRQGSVIAAINSSGVETAIYRYGPYGEPDVWSGSRFRYTGQIVLPELQLYHYKARAYDPIAGRFLQTDPIGYKDGPDWYLYVHDDPLNHADPTGDWDIVAPSLGTLVNLGEAAGVEVIGLGPEDPVADAGAAVFLRQAALSYARDVAVASASSHAADPPQEVKDKIPSHWGPGTPSNGGGVKWQDPKNPKGNNVRWEPGNPKSPNPRQQQPYVKVTRAGQTMGEDGKPIDPKTNGGKPGSTPESHIPQGKFCLLGICF